MAGQGGRGSGAVPANALCHTAGDKATDGVVKVGDPPY